MKYRVHLYVTVRVPFDDVEAESHVGAIENAKELFTEESIRRGEYADEITAAMVDEVGDEQYARTTVHEFPTTGF